MSDPFASLIIRPGAPGDLNRVRKDWMLSFATSNFARYLTPRADWATKAGEIYWVWQRAIVERLLASAELWVAGWNEDHSTIIGWAVLERGSGVVHYVYVGEKYRRSGVAKRLVAPALEQPHVTYTHRTTVCGNLPIPPGWTYDPRPAVLGRGKERA